MKQRSWATMATWLNGLVLGVSLALSWAAFSDSVLFSPPPSPASAITGTSPVVIVNTREDLARLSTTVVRRATWLSNTNGSGRPAIDYVASSHACSLHGGAGDSGAQIPSSDGRCWIAQWPASGADARIWNIQADGYVAGDGMIAAGAASFSSMSRRCVSEDIGKIIIVAGAGPAQAPLKTTIAACSGTAYILATPAGASASGSQWAIGTDNARTIAAIVADHPNLLLRLPAGKILIDDTTINLRRTAIEGATVPADRTAAFGSNADAGTQILLTSATVQPFVVFQSVSIRGVSFFWPGQAGITTAPISYPPLFMDSGMEQLSDFYFENNGVVNAYDFFVQNAKITVMGGAHFDGNHIYAIRRAFSVSWVGETLMVNGSIFNPSVYYSVANSGSRNLGKWSIQNGTFLHVFGPGDSAACATRPMGGMQFSGGTTVNGFKYAVHVDGGWLDETSFGDVDINGVQIALRVEANGLVSQTKFSGRIYPNGGFGIVPTAPAFQLEGTCAGQTFTKLSVSSQIVGAGAGVMHIGGTRTTNVDVKGAEIYDYGSNTTLSNPVYLLTVDNPNARVLWAANK